jgi:hypothetical protein
MIGKSILSTMVCACLLALCSKSPTQPPLSSLSFDKLPIMSADISGWTPADTGVVFADTSKSNVFWVLLDGGASEYFIPGFREGMVQNLRGPLLDSADTNMLIIYAIDYQTAANASKMFGIKKADWAAGNGTVSISPFDKSVAIGKVVAGFIACAHFDQYYIELTLTNFADSTSAENAASRFLQFYKQKIN